MKTTIKAHMLEMQVKPSKVAGFVDLNCFNSRGNYVGGASLTQVHCTELISGLDAAMYAGDVIAVGVKASGAEMKYILKALWSIQQKLADAAVSKADGKPFLADAETMAARNWLGHLISELIAQRAEVEKA